MLIQKFRVIVFGRELKDKLPIDQAFRIAQADGGAVLDEAGELVYPKRKPAAKVTAERKEQAC